MNSSAADILFVDNGASFIFYSEIARVLQRRDGLTCSFATLVPGRVQYIAERGIEARFLDLSRPTEDELQRGSRIIAALESRFPRFQLEFSIDLDRVLRWYSKRRSRRLLAVAAARFDRLLDELNPKLVLWEITWAIECLFYFQCLDRGIPYRHLLNLPTRKPMIALFDIDHSAEGTLHLGQGEEAQATGDGYYALIEQVKKYRPSIGYFASNFSLIYSRNDYRQALFYRLRRLLLPVFGLLRRLMDRMWANESPSGGRNLLLALHVQPESTPDVVSPFWRDQLELARKVSEAMPSDCTLYIKDHPLLISIRSPLSLARLLMTRRVRWLPSGLRASNLIPKFDLVLSIAGTALAEAARHGKPALSFSGVFFNGLPNVIDGRNYADLAQALDAALGLKCAPMPQESVDAFLRQHGMPGTFHDPRLAPQVMHQDNLDHVATAIKAYLNKWTAQKRQRASEAA